MSLCGIIIVAFFNFMQCFLQQFIVMQTLSIEPLLTVHLVGHNVLKEGASVSSPVCIATSFRSWSKRACLLGKTLLAAQVHIL